jgi:hypothetical protein
MVNSSGGSAAASNFGHLFQYLYEPNRILAEGTRLDTNGASTKREVTSRTICPTVIMPLNTATFRKSDAGQVVDSLGITVFLPEVFANVSQEFIGNREYNGSNAIQGTNVGLTV